MHKGLHFNICDIKMSYFPNSSITREQLNLISPTLSYCCHYWAYHLAQPEVNAFDFQETVLLFMKQKLLYWLEVLNIQGIIADVAIPLRWSFSLADRKYVVRSPD